MKRTVRRWALVGAKSGVWLKGQPTRGVVENGVCWARPGSGGWWYVCDRYARGATSVRAVQVDRNL